MLMEEIDDDVHYMLALLRVVCFMKDREISCDEEIKQVRKIMNRIYDVCISFGEDEDDC